MKITRTEGLAILRTLLSAIGAYVLGVNIFGINVDMSIWQTIVGGVMALAGMYLSWRDKTITEEKIAGFLRQFITVAGGLGVAYGKIKTEIVVTALAFIPIITAYIKGILDRSKSAKIASGAISVADLKK